MLSLILICLQLSPGGILDEETIARGLSTLGRSADGVNQVYLHCTIAVSFKHFKINMYWFKC